MTEENKHRGIEYVPVDFDPFGSVGQVRVPTTEAQREIFANIRFGGRPANCAYNESVSLLLTGPFSRPAFSRAAAELVRRHEALRASFTEDGTEVIIADSLEAAVTFTDLSDSDKDDQDRVIERILSEEAETEFDVLNGPMFRFRLVRLKDDVHQVILTFHHLVCDGWSLGILMQDMGALYSNAVDPSVDTVRSAQSFIEANKRNLHSRGSEETKEAENFWIEQYSGQLPEMELECDKLRPRIRTYNANRIDIRVPDELVVSVKALGAGNRTSYISTLIALFECYLARITGSDDITLGLPSAGQAMFDDQNLVGHYVNMLPLRSKVDISGSFMEYIVRRRGELLDAFENQDVTFGRLLNLLRIKRDPSRIPLIPVSFNVDLGITNGVSFKDCNLQFSTNPRHYENHEIFINAAGSNDELTLECTYNTDLFEEIFIKSRINGFLTFIKDVVAHPEKRLSHLNILSEADWEMLDSWNPGQLDFDRGQTIVSLFNASVSRHPERTAIDFHGGSMSYKELHNKALAIAELLKGSGTGEGNFIGICMERTPMMVASMLGVMYTGAAYVPLDVDYPEDRLRFILEDSGCDIVLTNDGSPAFIHDLGSVKEINVSDVSAGSSALSDAWNDSPSPRSASYVIYTSGSTGKPKGVVIEHRNAVALFAWASSVYDEGQLRGVVASTSICFDLSVFEIFNTLVAGGTLILIDDITALSDLPADSKPTLINSVPSAVKELTGSEDFPGPTVNTINLAGEPLSRDLVDRLYEYPNVKYVYDLYGPSEDTTYSTYMLREKHGPEVIGKVLPNSRVYLVDTNHQRVQPGLTGEIWLAGEKVARGYLNRKELTESKFTEDPFSDLADSRVYKTGDLAKFNPDGDLVFLGRTDHQVKIRGYRIEPGEVEARISELPEITGVVCVSRKNDFDADSLVCYYTSVKPLGNEDLVSHCSVTLPDYMIPSYFIQLDELPMTLNGKVDKNKLPDLTGIFSDRSGSLPYEEPEGPFEEALSVIFSEVLAVDRIGRKDDFFELGGHSLLGVRVVNLIGSQLGIRVALPVLFTAPTIEKLARVISGEESGKKWSSLVPLKKEGAKPPLFCVHMHNGNIHRWRIVTRYMDDDQPVYAIQPRGLDPKQEPHLSVEEMARYYVEQIRNVQPHGPYRLLGLCFSGMVVYEMAVILQEQGEKVAFLGMVNNYAPPENPTMYKLKTEWNKFMRMEIGEKFNYAIRKNKNLGRRLFVNRNQPEDISATASAGDKELIGNDLRSVHSLALLNYHPAHQYRGDLTIIRTDEPIEDLYNDVLGWDRLVKGEIRSHVIEGCDNDTIITDHPYNKELSLIIRDNLRRLEPGNEASGTDAEKKSPGGASSAAIL